MGKSSNIVSVYSPLSHLGERARERGEIDEDLCGVVNGYSTISVRQSGLRASAEQICSPGKLLIK